MDVWFSIEEEPLPRGTKRELKALKNFTHALSKARQESFCPLDTDLSWMSDYRTWV
jgi:hypothetical protein